MAPAAAARFGGADAGLRCMTVYPGWPKADSGYIGEGEIAKETR